MKILNGKKSTKLICALIGIMGMVTISSESFSKTIQPSSQKYSERRGFDDYVTQKELEKKLEEKAGGRLHGFHCVDLRNEADFKESFIPGAISIPYKKLSYLAEKIFSKSDEIVFYGYSEKDSLSSNAMVMMKNKGFKNCSILKGGIRVWSGKLEQGILDND